MARSEILKLDVPDLKKVRAKLREDVLVRPFLRETMDEIGRVAAAAGRGAAPAGRTGDLSAVTYKLSASETAITARVVSSARHGGYPYGKLLEFAAKYHHPRWLLHAIEGVKGQIEGLLGQMARKVERAWSD